MTDEYTLTHQWHSNADETFIEAIYSRKNTHYPVRKLSIPRFKGDVKEYTDFRNLFDTVVLENSNPLTVVDYQ